MYTEESGVARVGMDSVSVILSEYVDHLIFVIYYVYHYVQ